ncbi:flagellar operon protein (TIGR03826 family) [Lachnotalea glycerini]|uniref:Flagellar operon protein (TIGR03826 family) n=1 Tax=Lachnotalea glycerini TaxID=1763509 RepID=A0A255IHA6_9FIRM|nr:class I tRNA ligase family protein [Lachnotalea glycerini]PXV90171.1 flagellar operon protein (TIGR03826 family) [Lachnotalea glycerini]RDY31769.1 flagellar protein [Lachnotalea glycerini]
MDVRNCKKCRKLFNYIGGQPICPSCLADLEDEFQKVKVYLRENPKATMVMIAEDNEVSVQQIKQWIREERLSFTDDSPVAIECENCGTMIRTGRYCKQCKDKIANNMNEAIKKPTAILAKDKKPTREKERMRFLDKL